MTTTTTETDEREVWRSVAVTALPPGWRNVFSDDDGRYTAACPAVLLQELREVIHVTRVLREGSDTPRYASRTVRLEQPYETRVVFAFADCDNGHLDAACELDSYEQTVGPGIEVAVGERGGNDQSGELPPPASGHSSSRD